MKSVLIIGLGRFGRHVAMKLSEMNHQVLAVDTDEERLNDAMSFVTSGQIGDATNEAFLSSLGVGDFDACIVAIGDDFQSSLEATSLLKELGARHVIARASTGVQEKFLLKNGADEVVYPEKQLANWTAIRCTSDHILDYVDLDGDWAIFELEVPEHWWGRNLVELDIRRKHGINVLGVRVNGSMNMNVTPDTVLHPGASVLVLGMEQEIHKCFKI